MPQNTRYIHYRVKKMKQDKAISPKVRVNPEGYMGSDARVHKPRKGKGSYSRKFKHKANNE